MKDSLEDSLNDPLKLNDFLKRKDSLKISPIEKKGLRQKTLELFSLGLRGKLLVASLSVFILPIASYYYLVELETFLKDSQSMAQLESSQLMASFFDHNHLINQSNEIHNKQQPIYVYALENPPLIDGYDDDWQQWMLKKQSFNSSSGDKKFELYLGFKDHDLYIFLSIIDDSINYRHSKYPNQHDHIVLTLADDHNANKRSYQLETEAPGWFIARQQLNNSSPINPVIKGEWQENKMGYQLEFVIPLANFSQMMSIEIYDAGLSYSTQKKLLPLHLNPLIKESVLLRRKLQQLQEKLSSSNTRLYIVNKYHEILATAGQFTIDNLSYRSPNTLITHLTNIYRAIFSLDIQNQRYFEPLIYLHGKEIDDALDATKKPSSAWLAGSNSELLILSTAAAIKDNKGNIMGALVIEKTNASILALQDQTLEKFLLISLLLFFSTIVVLLIYSGRLVHRVLHLKQSIEKVMTYEGKLKQQFNYQHSRDEMGQLSQSFAILFEQLNQYTGYLETMVSKLSHELGTPLSIIKSSLENMQFQGVADDNKVFLKRAMDAGQRLSLMLTRMGEASRLEQALQSSNKESIEINSFLFHYIEAIQFANSTLSFSLNLPENTIYGMICPELMAQLLDKLISNAISFHTPKSTIMIKLSKNKQKSIYSIDVFNQGQWIPDKIKNSLFDSMVSLRSIDRKDNHNKSSQIKPASVIKSSSQVNLGLGLHISKLISHYHHGKIFYINRKKEDHYLEQGVSFIVELDLATII